MLHVGNFFTFGYLCIYVFYCILCAMFIVPLHVGGGDTYNWSHVSFWARFTYPFLGQKSSRIKNIHNTKRPVLLLGLQGGP